MSAVLVLAPPTLLALATWPLFRYQSSGLGGPPRWTDESIGYRNIDDEAKP